MHNTIDKKTSNKNRGEEKELAIIQTNHNCQQGLGNSKPFFLSKQP